MYFFLALEARSLKSRFWQDHTPSQGSRGKFLLASSSFWQLQVIRGLWQHNFNLCLRVHMASFLPVSVASLLIEIFITGLRVHPVNPRLSHFEFLYLIINLQRPFFQIRSHAQVSRVRTWTYVFGGHHSTHYNLWSSILRFCSFNTHLLNIYYMPGAKWRKRKHQYNMVIGL